MLRSSNPVLRDAAFKGGAVPVGGEVMTLDGTINKCFVALALTVLPALFTFSNPALALPFIFPGAIGGLIVAIVLSFKKSWAPILTPAYAILEGTMLGAISALYNAQYPGIALQAITLTMLTFLCLLFAYKSGWIHASENLKLGLAAATGAICLYYILSLVLGLFGFHALSQFNNSNSLASIGLSVVICGVAALSLVMDFDFIENGAKSGSQPKYMEWYGAFGLLVTLVWLYLEILRLLAKLQSRK